MLKWKEITEMRSYTCDTGQIKFSVTRHIYYDPKDWLLVCHDLNIDYLLLSNKELELAKKEAIMLIRLKVKEIANSLFGE